MKNQTMSQGKQKQDTIKYFNTLTFGQATSMRAPFNLLLQLSEGIEPMPFRNWSLIY